MILGGFVVQSAMKLDARSIVPQKRVVPLTDREGAKAFSAIVIPFSYGELAQAAERSKEAAKAWKEGRSMPSALSLLKMAKQIPAINNWVLGMLGSDAEHEAPQVMNTILGSLQTVAAMPGQDGAQARAVLAQMMVAK